MKCHPSLGTLYLKSNRGRPAAWGRECLSGTCQALGLVLWTFPSTKKDVLREKPGKALVIEVMPV